MKGTAAVLDRWVEFPETQKDNLQLSLSPDEVSLVRTSLQTLLSIYTRHEGYRDIHRLLAKLHVNGGGSLS